MKLQKAFKLSALAVALASTASVYAFTADQEYVEVNTWDSARQDAPSNADRTPDSKDVIYHQLDEKGQLALDAQGKVITGKLPGLEYQYVDVGSSSVKQEQIGQVETTNQLTELYRSEDKDSFVIKISPLGSDTSDEGTVYKIIDEEIKSDLAAFLGLDKNVEGWLKNVVDTDIAAFFDSRSSAYLLELTEDQNNVPNIHKDMVYLAGLTKNEVSKQFDVSDIRRLDSSYLEYAHESSTYIASKDLGGNLTNDNKEQSLVLGNTEQIDRESIILNKQSAGVTNGILNNKNADDIEIDVAFKDRIYGLNVHNSFESRDLDNNVIYSKSDYAQVEAAKIVVASTTEENGVKTENSTVITSEGITTGKLTVGGVDVGQTLENVATLGSIDTEKLTDAIEAGEKVAAFDSKLTTEVNRLDERVDGVETSVSNLADRVGDVETSVSGLNSRVDDVEKSVTALDTKITDEVSRLDGRIDSELAKNAEASTAYTDQTATTLREEAATESARLDQAIVDGDKATLASAKAEDAKTLTTANSYTDTKVSGINTSITAGDKATLASANTYADDGDAKTLASANAYTDSQVAGFGSRVNQLNSRISDVEKTAYRGVAIALAAQQQIPNIGAGQIAVFGGAGHYEGETAGALGVAGVLADGRTSLSAAVGVAGGSEVGGRVGVSYVFGGK